MMDMRVEALQREVRRCSDGAMTPEYRALLDALDDVPLTQELVDYLCRMIVAKKYIWEIHFDHLRPLLLNSTTKQFDLKAFFAERFSRSRRLCMKMHFLRGYAMYATEVEVDCLCRKFITALGKGQDYVDYIDIMSEAGGVPYLVRTYGYACFHDAWNTAQAEYARLNPLLRGHTTIDARLRHVNLISAEESYKRHRLFIEELKRRS